MKALLSGYFGFDNFGDEAILSELCSHLKNSGIDVTVLSSNPDKTANNYSVCSVYSFDILGLVNAIKRCDILISGGGSLLQDVTSVKSLIYYLFVICCALFSGKKVVIFAQGIGPINNYLAKIFTLFILKKCDFVSVRDKKSYDFLKLNGVSSILLCDPIFSLSLPDYKPEKMIGVQLRNCANMNDVLLNNLAHYISDNFNDYQINIISFQDKLDLEVCGKFASILKGINSSIEINVLSKLDNNKIIKILSRCEYLFAMRFHALVVALKFGIKAVGINYDIKVETLANEFGLSLISMNGDIKDSDIHSVSCEKQFDWSELDNFLNNISNYN